MQRISKLVTKTVYLADRLLDDIKDRGLKAGDTYFTTQDARRFLGVGGTAANRALQLLEKRRIIERTQGRGAVILKTPNASETPPITQVHILIPELYFRTEGFGCDGILFGLQSEFPTAHVSHCLLQQDAAAADRVNALIRQTIANGGTDAFVLASVPFEIQRAIACTGFPSVVYGTAYRGIGELSQLERDLNGAVVELVDHLRSRGARRIATLLRQYIMPGDHQVFNAVLSTLGASAPIRFLGADKEHIIAEIVDILRNEPNVDGFLCQTVTQAEAVEEALARENRSRNGVRIGVLLSYAKRSDPFQFTHVRMVLTPEEIGRKLASILQSRYLGRPPEKLTIPIELVET